MPPAQDTAAQRDIRYHGHVLGTIHPMASSRGQHVQERRGAADGRHTTSSSAVTLGEIEKLGWRLEHASYFFMMTGETSTARVFVSGEATAISGVTVGVYLFRNTEFL